MRILIIDEDEISLYITQKVLCPEFEVNGFHSIDEAKNWAKDNHFDILLANYTVYRDPLPVHAIKELKDINGGKFHSVIATTYIDPAQADQLLEKGYSNIFMKPISKAAFTEYFNRPGRQISTYSI
jgi:DNA-binding NtrC family response regulator